MKGAAGTINCGIVFGQRTTVLQNVALPENRLISSRKLDPKPNISAYFLHFRVYTF